MKEIRDIPKPLLQILKKQTDLIEAFRNYLNSNQNETLHKTFQTKLDKTVVMLSRTTSHSAAVIRRSLEIYLDI